MSDIQGEPSSEADRYPTDVPVRVPRSEVRFADDVRKALAVCRRQPALPIMSACFGAVTAVGGSDLPGSWLAAIATIVFFGWVGAERLWFLRGFTGRPMTAQEALRASLRYFGRFTRLLFLIYLVTLPLTIPWAVAVWRAMRPPVGGGGGLAASAYIAVVLLILDFALTFVTPALVYSTDSVVVAMRVGRQVLRATWPHSAPYVLVPPLAVVLLTRMQSGPIGPVGAAVVIATALLSLVARGATAAFYLRIMTPVSPDGAVSLRDQLG